MHWFCTKLSPFFSVCLFVFFSFFLPPPILGIRSLAGGRREYGRSGREPLFLNPFFYMLVFRLFPFILSWSWVENAAIPTQFVRHFRVFICSHTETGWIGSWPLVLRWPRALINFTTKSEFSVRRSCFTVHERICFVLFISSFRKRGSVWSHSY